MKYLLLLLVFSFSSLNAQSDLNQKELNKEMEDAFKQMQESLDTIDIQKLFEQGFGMMENENSMDQIKGMMDSLDINQLFGGDFSQLFGENGLQMEGFEMTDLNKMMEQSMKMLENMDPKMMENMMKGLDFKEFEKMFEHMDLEDLENLNPAKPAKDKKGIKKA